jgi:hypothetical protein
MLIYVKKTLKKKTFYGRADGQSKTIVLTISIKSQINKSINYVYLVKFFT